MEIIFVGGRSARDHGVLAFDWVTTDADFSALPEVDQHGLEGSFLGNQEFCEKKRMHLGVCFDPFLMTILHSPCLTKRGQLADESGVC